MKVFCGIMAAMLFIDGIGNCDNGNNSGGAILIGGAIALVTAMICLM